MNMTFLSIASRIVIASLAACSTTVADVGESKSSEPTIVVVRDPAAEPWGRVDEIGAAGSIEEHEVLRASWVPNAYESGSFEVWAVGRDGRVAKCKTTWDGPFGEERTRVLERVEAPIDFAERWIARLSWGLRANSGRFERLNRWRHGAVVVEWRVGDRVEIYGTGYAYRSDIPLVVRDLDDAFHELVGAPRRE
jgi:hypothetical protein